MDVHDLESFVSVVEHGGFRAAAEALFISQPSLSRRVKNLENELGVQLLDRGPWGLRLTGHGETLLRGARRVFTAMDDVRTATAGAWGNTLKLGAAATAAGSFLAPFLSEWIPTHPQLRIQMIEDGAVRLRRRLSEGQCDVAIVAAPVPAEFDHLPITEVAVQALIPPGHALAGEEGPVGPEALDGQEVLVNGRRFLSSELLMAACRVVGAEPRVVYESSVGQTLAALAESGLGIAVISDNVDLRGFDLPRRPVVDGEGRPLTFGLHIAWLRERTLAPIVYEFVEELSAFTHPLRLHSVGRAPGAAGSGQAQRVAPGPAASSCRGSAMGSPGSRGRG